MRYVSKPLPIGGREGPGGWGPFRGAEASGASARVHLSGDRVRAAKRYPAAWPSAVLLLLTLFGCAPVQPPGATSMGSPPAAPGTASRPAHSGVAVGNTASGGAIVSSGAEPTVVDSGPSAEALAVLATIPEPLSSSERVPPPGASPTGTAGKTSSPATGGRTTAGGAAGAAAGGAAGATAAGGAGAGAAAGAGASAAPGAAASTGAGASSATGAAAGAGASGGAAVGATAGAAAAGAVAGARPDSARGDLADSAATAAAEDSLIPVPAPTEPLGERPGTLARALADTTPPPPPPPPAAPAPAKAGPDSCWRIQVAAPPTKQEADLKRQAAESVLLVPFTIDHEKQRYKVRNRDCLTREVADRLRRRAIESGFDGTFPVVEVRK